MKRGGEGLDSALAGAQEPPIGVVGQLVRLEIAA